MSRLIITSRQNPRVKQAATLRNRKSREACRQTLVFGVRESQRAAAVGAPVREVFACPRFYRTAEVAALVAALEDVGAEVFEVAPEVFEKLAYGDRMDGVIAVVDTQSRRLASLDVPERPLVAVVDRIEKPGNLGAILRSADGAGVDAVVVVDPVIDLFNPNSIRASVGAVFRDNVAVAAGDEARAWLADLAIPLLAADPEAETLYTAADFRGGAAVLLGNEAEGLGNEWKKASVTPVKLPMHGIADSLNVSATAAVLFYEARRQRDAGR